MSYDYEDDDVVVEREGGYYGGAIGMPSFVSKTALSLGRFVNTKIYGNEYNNDYKLSNWTTGYVVIVLLIVAVILLLWYIGWLGTHSGMGNIKTLLAQSQGQNFVNSRDAPYFPDVTNDVLRREDMEAEAVRALAKINQERTRRAVPSDSTPLEWGPFWDEWRQTHGATDNVVLTSEGLTNMDTDNAMLGR